MRMICKQRMLSWLDNYDIYAEDGSTLFTVKGVMSWGHCLKILDADGYELGCIKEELISFLPRFTLYQNGVAVGCIRKKLSFLKPKFTLDMNEWTVEGDWLGWNYEVCAGTRQVAVLYQELDWTDVYVIDVHREEEALTVLMIVLAIDAAKCSDGN